MNRLSTSTYTHRGGHLANMSEYNEEDDFNSDGSENEDDYSFPADQEDDGEENNEHRQDEEEPDEQKTQVYTGKIDVLQQEVDTLRDELQRERAAHSMAKNDLAIAQQPSRDDKGPNRVQSMDTCSTTGHLSVEVMNAFRKFCESHDIHTHSSLDNLHDEDCKYVLQEATRIINASEQRAQRAQSACKQSKLPSSDTDLASRVRNLESELRIALSATDDIKALKAKLLYMVERSRADKEKVLKSEASSSLLRKTIKMLSDHIEKLMSYLKHEAASKLRILDKQRAGDRRIVELEESISMLQKKGSAKDRLIVELREGSKILEDQLRLMDDKFLELRSKLDFARENDEKKTKKAAKEAAELRAKIATLHFNSRSMPYSSSLPDIYEGTREVGRETTGTMGGGGGGGKKRNKKDKKPEVTIDSIIDKLRKQTGPSVEWTEERARELVLKKVPRK